MNAEVLENLQKLFGPDCLVSEMQDLVPYSYDGTAVLNDMADVVVFSKTAREVSQTILLAKRHHIPVVTRGSGTGLSGGHVPHEEGIVQCLTKSSPVLELDRKNLTLLVEPGVTNEQISNTSAAIGLFYPRDPGSMKSSFIGGNVTCNSGGSWA